MLQKLLEMHWLCALALSFSLLSSVSARLQDGRPHANIMPTANIPLVSIPSTTVVSRNGTTLPPYTTVYLFDQLIDHNNPSLGTFKQRFWHTYEFYESGIIAPPSSVPSHSPLSGGPIILMTPGETDADGTRICLSGWAYAQLRPKFRIWRVSHQQIYQRFNWFAT